MVFWGQNKRLLKGNGHIPKIFGRRRRTTGVSIHPGRARDLNLDSEGSTKKLSLSSEGSTKNLNLSSEGSTKNLDRIVGSTKNLDIGLWGQREIRILSPRGAAENFRFWNFKLFVSKGIFETNHEFCAAGAKKI